MRASMSATGSVNLIVCFSSSHPFAPHLPENPRQLALLLSIPVVLRQTHRVWQRTRGRRANCSHPASGKPRDCHTCLPGRLRNPGNLSPQRQPAETQTADAELPQVSARTPADLAAVVLARRELGLACVLHSFCCSSQFRSYTFRLERCQLPPPSAPGPYILSQPPHDSLIRGIKDSMP